MEFLSDFMVPIVVGVCLCVGYVLKNVIPSEKVNKFIPLILGILGVGINVWANDFAFTPQILLSGLFSGLASTGMHQAFTQLISKETK